MTGSRPTPSGSGIGPGRGDCHGRDEILATLDDRHRREIFTELVEARNGQDDTVLVRWGGRVMEPRFKVAGGVASIVVTLDGDHVTSIRDCTGHAEALTLTGLADAA
jgi:hypothetical protein